MIEKKGGTIMENICYLFLSDIRMGHRLADQGNLIQDVSSSEEALNRSPCDGEH